MALVRTNITLPAEVLALVDQVAGPRGRSAYIADVVARQVRRDNALRVIRETAGALRGSKTWGETPEETDRILRELRDSSGRDRMLYGDAWVDGEAEAEEKAR
jgi:metal-responsive CopG/Arc/MetJ family transcriptional regulator